MVNAGWNVAQSAVWNLPYPLGFTCAIAAAIENVLGGYALSSQVFIFKNLVESEIWS